jgi:PST family polysaccharide transporter
VVEQTIHKNFIQGAVILTIAGILAKVMGALYRVPFQNIAGDIGYYVYQQVYPFYGISFALAMYGFPVIISKMVTESKKSQTIYNKQEVIYISSFILGAVFTVFFMFIFFGSNYIAQLMRDPLLDTTIKAVSFSFLILPIISVLRGMYQGYENMLPTATSQVVEQFSRVTFIIIVSIVISINSGSAYQMGTGAALGGVVGGLLSVCTLLFFLRKVKNNFDTTISLSRLKVWIVTKRLLLEGIAISISATMLILFQFIDAFQIPYLLGDSKDISNLIKSEKGVFDRGQPLLQLGIIVATSMSLSLIPFISKAYFNKDWNSITKSTVTALKVGIVLGGAASVGLAIIIAPTNIMLFRDQSGSVVLGILGIAILFATVALIAGAILQGIGKTLITTKNVLLGAFTKGILNILLIPLFGILGAAISTVIGVAIITLCNILTLYKSVPNLNKQRFYSLKIVISLVTMAIITFVWKELLINAFPGYEYERLLAALITLSSTVVGFITYLLCLNYFSVWEQAEMQHLPGSLKYFSRVGKRKEQNG